MKTKDQVEVELASIKKVARSTIRLKHALAADREINESLPRIEVEFWAAVNEGKPYKLEAVEL